MGTNSARAAGLVALPQLLSSPNQPSSRIDDKAAVNISVQRDACQVDGPMLEDNPSMSSGNSDHSISNPEDTRIIVIIHAPGQAHIVSVFAQVLGKSFIIKSELGAVSSHDHSSVVGLSAEDAKRSFSSRDQKLVVVINAHCVEVSMPPDIYLSENCDYEFLYNSDSPVLRRDSARFASFVLGQSSHHDQLMAKSRTYFLSMTFPDVRAALPNIDILTVGSDAVELRIDLLQEPLANGGFAEIPSLSYVGEQVMLLRQHTELPIIFTARGTDFSNGRFPMTDPELYHKYLSKAIQWGLEYVDVELWLPEGIRRKLYESRGHSRIMSAFHDFSGKFRWPSSEAEFTFRRSLMYADMIKMIAIVDDQSANFELEYFRSRMRSEHPQAPPFSGVNMGEVGQLSRTLNKVFTPVTHPLLPVVAAPGQMSAAQINSSLSSLGHLPPKSIYGLFMAPQYHALTQASFYEKCFNELGLPHQFAALYRQTKGKREVLGFLGGDKDFGGACLNPGWTLSSLIEAWPGLVGEGSDTGPVVSTVVHATGIVDLIVVQEILSSKATSTSTSPSSPRQGQSESRRDSGSRSPAPSSRIIFENVSCRGVLRALTVDFAPSAYLGRSAIVLSASSHDVAPSLVAMKSLGISKVYTVGFKTPETLVKAAPLIEPVVNLETLQRARMMVDKCAPCLIVSALSSGKSNLVALVVRAFAANQSQEAVGMQRVFLDLAEQRDGNSSELSLIAEQCGFKAYDAADVAAFVTVESLRLLVGQNVPHTFVQLANGTRAMHKAW